MLNVMFIGYFLISDGLIKIIKEILKYGLYRPNSDQNLVSKSNNFLFSLNLKKITDLS